MQALDVVVSEERLLIYRKLYIKGLPVSPLTTHIGSYRRLCDMPRFHPKAECSLLIRRLYVLYENRLVSSTGILALLTAFFPSSTPP